MAIKKHGRSRKAIRPNDIAYITKLNRLGQVLQLGENQLKLMYKDASNNAHEDWFPKSELFLILGGTSLDPEYVPKAMDKEMERVDPQKELTSG